MASHIDGQPTLQAFITNNLYELTERSRARVARRKEPLATRSELGNGVRLLLVQIAALLERSAKESSPGITRMRLEAAASAHGKELLAEGLTIGQVVHGYGDVCQVVTELASERNVNISTDDFRAFNGCLDEAIAHAVTEYSTGTERAIAAAGTEQSKSLARELRKALATAMLSFDAIKRGVAGTSVSKMHTHSLMRLGELIETTCSEAKLEGQPGVKENLVLADFIEEVEIAAMFQARADGLDLLVSPVATDISIFVNRQAMAGALSGLLNNAFKFTRARSLISLHAHATPAQVFIEIEDECGGLSDGRVNDLMLPFEPSAADKRGPGRGLIAARQAIEANGGALRLQSIPSVGCRFTIELPRTEVGH